MTKWHERQGVVKSHEHSHPERTREIEVDVEAVCRGENNKAREKRRKMFQRR